MFLAEFCEEYLGQRLGVGREQSHVQQASRVGVNRHKQPVAVVIHVNYRLVNRGVMQVLSLSGL